MRSALRTSAGPKARYADWGSAAGSTLDAHGHTSFRFQGEVDRAVLVGRAAPAVRALRTWRAVAQRARAVIGADARRAGLAAPLAGRAQPRALGVGQGAGGV